MRRIHSHHSQGVEYILCRCTTPDSPTPGADPHGFDFWDLGAAVLVLVALAIAFMCQPAPVVP